MEEEKKAALRKQQEISDEPEVIAYNPRKVNNWLQNMNGVSRNQDDRFQENYLYGTLPNGFRHHEQRSSQQGNEDLHKNSIPVKSRAESYHTYNKYDQMASHREKWDLVRQRSRSTDALPRKNENKHNKEDQYTHRSSKDLQEFNDGKQMFPDIYSDNIHSYESYNIANNDDRATRFYSEYERSSQRPVDTYETLVTEREALHSDYQLFKDRDESRFRAHRSMLASDNVHERNRISKTDRQRRPQVKDINEEVDRILKERNNGEIFGDHKKADKQYEQEKTYKEKEQDEMRQIHKYWAINEAFEKDLQTGLKDSPKTTIDSDERKNQTKHEITAEDKEGIELTENKRVNENSVEKKANNAKENKEAKKTKIKYENQVYVESSKQKSRHKGSKKSKKQTSKTSSATLVTSVKHDSIQDRDNFVTDGKTDITTTSSGAYSPMKRYDSQVEKRYLQFDKYTDSDVYPRTPEPSLTQDNLKRKHKFEENKQRRSLKSNEDRHYNEQDRGNKTKYNNDQDEIITDNSKSVKSFSSRPTIDSRTVKFPNKEGESTGKTFSVLAGDVGMMEQFQNISEGLRSYNVSVKVV